MNSYSVNPPVRQKSKPIKALGIVLCVLSGLFIVSLAVVFPKQREYIVELGEKASVSPSDYLFGYPFIVQYADVDVSGVNTDRVGEYSAAARLLFYRYHLNVTVRDTVPPEIVPFEDELFIATGREYAPEDFAGEINDASGEVDCRIRYGGGETERISFPQAGAFVLTLEAEDASGNVGTREIAFAVDDPPVIIGAFDRHLPVGTDFDVTKAAAVDTGDGNLTDRMSVDRGGFDPRTEGEYTVTYTVADSHGLVTEKSVTLSVRGKNQLSLYQDDISLKPEELKLLCDAGYFTYQPLDAPDYDKAVQLLEPALVDFKQVRSNGYAAGSGCIYRITPEYVYFLSVRHVMEAVHYNCRIMFFDGMVVKQSIDYATSQKNNELSMFRIPVSDIPTDTLMTLRQVYVDREIYTKLSEGDEVVAFAKHWTGTDKDLIKRLKVRSLTSSIGEFGFYNSLLETTSGVQSGMSGTAVIDLRGNLVGLASAFGTATGNKNEISSFHSKIDVLDEVENALGERSLDNAA